VRRGDEGSRWKAEGCCAAAVLLAALAPTPARNGTAALCPHHQRATTTGPRQLSHFSAAIYVCPLRSHVPRIAKKNRGLCWIVVTTFEFERNSADTLKSIDHTRQFAAVNLFIYLSFCVPGSASLAPSFARPLRLLAQQDACQNVRARHKWTCRLLLWAAGGSAAAARNIRTIQQSSLHRRQGPASHPDCERRTTAVRRQVSRPWRDTAW
jgi:hypothetical protein